MINDAYKRCFEELQFNVCDIPVACANFRELTSVSSATLYLLSAQDNTVEKIKVMENL